MTIKDLSNVKVMSEEDMRRDMGPEAKRQLDAAEDIARKLFTDFHTELLEKLSLIQYDGPFDINEMMVNSVLPSMGNTVSYMYSVELINGLAAGSVEASVEELAEKSRVYAYMCKSYLTSCADTMHHAKVEAATRALAQMKESSDIPEELVESFMAALKAAKGRKQ